MFEIWIVKKLPHVSSFGINNILYFGTFWAQPTKNSHYFGLAFKVIKPVSGLYHFILWWEWIYMIECISIQKPFSAHSKPNAKKGEFECSLFSGMVKCLMLFDLVQLVTPTRLQCYHKGYFIIAFLKRGCWTKTYTLSFLTNQSPNSCW